MQKSTGAAEMHGSYGSLSRHGLPLAPPPRLAPLSPSPRSLPHHPLRHLKFPTFPRLAIHPMGGRA